MPDFLETTVTAMSTPPRRHFAFLAAPIAALCLSPVVSPAAPAGDNAGATRAPANPAAGAAMVGVPDFSRITQRYGPAVVNISVSGIRQVTAGNEGPDGADDGNDDKGDPTQLFLRRFQQQFGGSGATMQVPVRGFGSGVIMSADGLILTNAHVVANASDVIVKLTDRREFRAQILGRDPSTDIAVLKIDADNLPTVSVGNPDDLKVGEWVLAIGSPFGFENSVTVGVVSAKGRSLPDGNSIPFIQTDAAVNPGNSGGPLFNAHGQVVGINSQIYSRTGGYQGISFAIPIDLALSVQRQLVATGHVSRGVLGVLTQDVNQALADAFKLAVPRGALILDVQPGGAGASAGLQPGDVILQAGNKPIVASGELAAIVAMASPGRSLDLSVWRDAKPVQPDGHPGRLRQAGPRTRREHPSRTRAGTTGTGAAGAGTHRAPHDRHGRRSPRRIRERPRARRGRAPRRRDPGDQRQARGHRRAGSRHAGQVPRSRSLC